MRADRNHKPQRGDAHQMKRAMALTPKGKRVAKQRGLTEQVVSRVRWRSKGVCEAYWIKTGDAFEGNCRNAGEHMHHALLKSRGGRILDRESFADHITLLCQRCHERAHADQEAGVRKSDQMPLIIRGEITERHNFLEYIGPSQHFMLVVHHTFHDNTTPCDCAV